MSGAFHWGGGWWVQQQGPFSGSAVCYAGGGCTYIPLLLSNPLASHTSDELRQATKRGECRGSRVTDVDEFVPPDFFRCTSPREGGAIYCSESTTSFNVVCGSGALLALKAHNGGPQVRIRQFSSFGFDFNTDVPIPGYSSDVECIIQDSILSCVPGWSYIYLWPNSRPTLCTYEVGDCDIFCKFSEGFTPIGCCPSGDVVTCNDDAPDPTEAPVGTAEEQVEVEQVETELPEPSTPEVPGKGGIDELVDDAINNLLEEESVEKEYLDDIEESVEKELEEEKVEEHVIKDQVDDSFGKQVAKDTAEDSVGNSLEVTGKDPLEVEEGAEGALVAPLQDALAISVPATNIAPQSGTISSRPLNVATQYLVSGMLVAVVVSSNS